MIDIQGTSKKGEKVSDLEEKGLSLLMMSGITEDKPKIPQYTKCLEKLVAYSIQPNKTTPFEWL